MAHVLRPHFGAHAGGLAHAFALATLAHAADQQAAPLVSYDGPPDAMGDAADFDGFSRLVTLLQDVVSHAAYTIDDLRREGFAEPVLSALRPQGRAGLQ